jgi:hypothetical protein
LRTIQLDFPAYVHDASCIPLECILIAGQKTFAGGTAHGQQFPRYLEKEMTNPQNTQFICQLTCW